MLIPGSFHNGATWGASQPGIGLKICFISVFDIISFNTVVVWESVYKCWVHQKKSLQLFSFFLQMKKVDLFFFVVKK